LAKGGPLWSICTYNSLKYCPACSSALIPSGNTPNKTFRHQFANCIGGVVQS
jgi:hypothetical protein